MTVERMCIGCRATDDRSRLLRMVADSSAPVPRVLPDPRARMQGRGAWIHPTPLCLERAERRKAFARALRVAGPVTITEVVALIDAAAARELLITEVGND